MAYRVVIVDDDPTFRRVAAALLTARGFEVVGSAADSASGLRAISELRPAAALVDLQLPDGSGLELAAQIQTLDPDTRVLLTSAGTNYVEAQPMADSGVRGFVPKERLASIDLVSALSL